MFSTSGRFLKIEVKTHVDSSKFASAVEPEKRRTLRVHSCGLTTRLAGLSFSVDMLS